MTVTCFDKEAKVHLTCYADMIVRDQSSRVVAIRFGGYPEHVRALTDCIAAGCSLTVDIGTKAGGNSVTMKSDKPHGYYRKVSYNGL
jgi:hypothetical protein